MTDDELGKWASAFSGFPSETTVDIAIAVLRLLAEKQAHMDASAALVIENAQLKLELAAMAERVHAQSELLSRKAEREAPSHPQMAFQGECGPGGHVLPLGGLTCVCGQMTTWRDPLTDRLCFGARENAEASIQPEEIEAYQKKLHDEMGKMKFTSLVWGR